ncbi:MAG TPA: C25 family cysteine peptidase [Williamwhitmania sp.]|nr:C25 family cysteine peptidase [Williamwhitmania sp.]
MKTLKQSAFTLTIFLLLMVNPMHFSNLFAQPLVAVVDTNAVNDEVNVTINSGKYDIVREVNGEIIRIKGFDQTTSPGDPILPQKVIDVVVPPNVNWKSIQIELEPVTKMVEGNHTIMPAPPLRARVGDEELLDWGIGKNIVDGKNVTIYGSNKFYPAIPVTVVNQSQMRKWKFVRLMFNPIQYNPITGQLRQITSINVKIKFRKFTNQTYINKALMRDKLMDIEAKQRFYNIGKQTDTWYGPLGGGDEQPLPTQYDYVIITTNAIVTGSGAGLTDFVNQKTSMGHSVLVVTESDYGSLTGQAPNGTAEKIRQWLIDNYITKGIKWVLLVGNPDPDDPTSATDNVGDVPMKMCWPNRTSYTYRESPTDYFYADLTSNWDIDGDGYYGEYLQLTNPTVPDPLISPNTYSVRWTGQIQFDADGNYNFYITCDEGMRVIIDGNTIVNGWVAHDHPENYSGVVAGATAGMHNVTVEYFNATFDGTAVLYWSIPGDASMTIVPSNKLFHLSGASYVSGGLSGEYFNNDNFTASALTRIDPTIQFFWGTGDRGIGGIDFTPEIYVGRIPVYNNDYTTLNSIFHKIINYQGEQVIPEWRRKLLFAAVNLWACGDNALGESLKKDFADPLGFSTYRVYEEDYGYVPAPECDTINPANPSSTAPCNMLGELTNGGGYGFLGWSTHGSTTSASKLLSSAQCVNLVDSLPFFTFQGSCLNGYPESATNLGYSLLKQGAIATVSASRVSWSGCFSPPANPASGANFSLSYSYAMRVLNGEPSGRSLFKTKDDVNPAYDWMNKMDFNLYGDPTTSLLKPYLTKDVDVMQILDHSGSMGGYTASTMTDKKIEILRDAANQFVDMMETNGNNQLGIVKFSTTATTPMNLQLLTAPVKITAHTQINALNPTATTSIGDGLTKGVTQFTAHSVAGHRKVVLLVTDGMQNTAPMIAAIQPDIIAKNITVYPLALGYGTGVNEDLLIDLANATGGDYRITDNALIFRKYFLEILASAVDWSVITDPIGNLANGATAEIPVTVTRDQNGVSFTSYWSGIDNAVNLTLITPSGLEITPAMCGSNSNIRYVSASRYAFYQIDFPLGGALAAHWQGSWKMRLTGTGAIPSGNTVQYSASALAKGGAKFDVSFDKVHQQTGDRIQILAKLIIDDVRLRGAAISVFTDVPKVCAGNVLHQNKVDVNAINKMAISQGDQMNLADAKLIILNEKAGKNLLVRDTGSFKLYDDGQHGDLLANDGIYGNNFDDTKKSGTYTFRFVASGIPTIETNRTTTREWTKSLYTSVAIDAASSNLTVTLTGKTMDGNNYFAKVTPKDKYNNFLGPGYDAYLVVVKPSGSRRAKLSDPAVDGTYSGNIVLTKAELDEGAKLQFEVDGKAIPATITGSQKLAISLHGGYAIPLTNMANTYDNGFGFLFDLEFPIKRNLSLVLYAGYNQFKSKVTGTDDLSITNISLNVKYYQQLPSNPSLLYYVNAGPGYYSTTDSHNGLGANIGAGFSYALGNRLSMELGADWHTIQSQRRKFAQIHLGLIYKF